MKPSQSLDMPFIFKDGSTKHILGTNERRTRRIAKALGLYNLACYYAIKEQPEEAIDQLIQAIECDLVAHLEVHDVQNDPIWEPYGMMRVSTPRWRR